MQLPSPIPHPLDLMPWDVPGWAHGLLEFAVGVDWPQGDEKAVWDLADQWFGAASTLVGPGEQAGAAAGEVLSGYGGAGLVADAFEHAWREVGVGEDAPLPTVIALCHELGDLVEGCGADIEAAKLEVYVELGLLLIELAALAVVVFLTFGAASPAAGAAAMATRLSIQQILRRLAARLGAKALREGAKEAAEQATKRIARPGFAQLAKMAGREALEEAAEQAATRMGTQAYQNATGRRHGVDLSRVGWSAMAGAAGGAAASAAHLGPQATGRLGGIGAGAARGAGGEVLADVAATLATGGSPGLDGLAEAATSGGAGHAVRHGTHELDQHLTAEPGPPADFGPVRAASGPGLPSSALPAADLPDVDLPGAGQAGAGLSRAGLEAAGAVATAGDPSAASLAVAQEHGGSPGPAGVAGSAAVVAPGGMSRAEGLSGLDDTSGRDSGLPGPRAVGGLAVAVEGQVPGVHPVQDAAVSPPKSVTLGSTAPESTAAPLPHAAHPTPVTLPPVTLPPAAAASPLPDAAVGSPSSVSPLPGAAPATPLTAVASPLPAGSPLPAASRLHAASPDALLAAMPADMPPHGRLTGVPPAPKPAAVDQALGSPESDLPPHEPHGRPLDPSEIPPPITDGPTFPTTPLPEHWRGEDDPPEVNQIWRRRQVVYLDADQRERFRIFPRDGLLYDRTGNLFDTTEGNSLWSEEGRAIFVMDQYGNFYASTEHAPGWFHHSSFLAGGPVAGAGELEVCHGRFVAMSDQSGHYRPHLALTDQVVNFLRGAGIKIDDSQVEINALY